MFSYGFYNSLNGDRKYNAEQMSSIFDGVIVDGVFENVGEIFATVPGAGLEVIVKTGRAWFKHTWSLNDSWMPLTLPEADTYRSRIDAVVLEVNHDIDVRKNEIKIVSGEPGLVAVKPTLVHDENVDQYALAYVTVKPFATSILEDDIEIAVGRGDTPFITCPLKTIPIDDLFNQWNGEFTTWFDNLKAQLTDNVVTNLQSQITANKEQLDDVQATLDSSLPIITDGMGAGSLFSVSKYYNQPIENAVLCNGGTVSGTQYPELTDILGMTYGGDVNFLSVDNQYGINSTYGYPQAYNHDNDFFVAVKMGNNGQITVYRKSQSPQIIPLPASVAGSYGGDEWTTRVISFGNIIAITPLRYVSTSYQYITTHVYDMTSGTWSNVSGFSKILYDYGDYLVTDSLNKIKKDSLGTYITLRIQYSGFSTSVTGNGYYIPGDDPNYIFTAIDSSGLSVGRISRSDFESAQNGASISGVKAVQIVNTSSNTYFIGGVVYKGYIYVWSSQRIWSGSCNNGSISNFTEKYTKSSSGSIAFNANEGVFVSKISEDSVALIFSPVYGANAQNGGTVPVSGNLAYYILERGNVINKTMSYGVYNSLTDAPNDVYMCTKHGATKINGFSTIKLPTITQSESLVYMRTKTPPKEA